MPVRRNFRLMIVPAIIVLAATVVFAPSAAFADTAVVSGHVYLGDSGHPAAGTATVVGLENGAAVTGATTSVANDGSWSLSGAIDSVRVHYSGGGPYLVDSGWGLAASGPTEITLPRTFTISGSVGLGSLSTHPPTASVRVTATGFASTYSTVVAADGSWSISGISAHSVAVSASWTAPTGAWNSADYTQPGCPATCQISIDSDRNGVDMILSPAGDLSGSVTRGGAADPNVRVYADDVNSDYSTSVLTDSGGRYEFRYLPAGSYSIYFQDPSADVADEVWNDQNPYLDPTLVRISSDSVSGIDADLKLAGTISGTVTSSDLAGADFDGSTIDVMVQDPVSGTWVDTDDHFPVQRDGSFRVDGLFSGTYRLEARYDGAKGTSFADSAAVAVGAGSQVTTSITLPHVKMQSGPPRGSLDVAYAGPTSITVGGWALDPDTTSSIFVDVYVDGVGGRTTASGYRPDVGSAFPGYGVAHGFTTTIDRVTAGRHTICAYAIDQGSTSPSNTQLGCRSVTVLWGPIIGSVDSVQVIPGAIIIRGWALDPQQNAPVTIQLSGDVENGQADWDNRGVADQPRPDIAAAFPGYGGAHGFTITSRIPIQGQRWFGVSGFASGVAGSSASLLLPSVTSTRSGLAITRYSVPPANPFGSLDSAQQTAPGQVSLAGWTLDTDATSPMTVHVYVDNTFAAEFAATGTRGDINAAFSPYAGPHGFTGVLSGLAGGNHTVCAYGINQGVGSNSVLGCRTVAVRGGSPLGSLDVARGTRPGTMYVAGWALDPDTSDPINVAFYVDGVGVSTMKVSDDRSDIAAAFPGWGARHGFSPLIFSVGGGTHTVCAYGINAPGTSGNNSLLGCKTFALPSGSPGGSVDSAMSSPQGAATLSGWAYDPDTQDPITVRLYVDGAYSASGVASAGRADVGAFLGPSYGDLHGFSVTTPQLSPGTHRVCAYGINIGVGNNTTLGCVSVAVGG